jgi:hypothetical protein
MTKLLKNAAQAGVYHLPPLRRARRLKLLPKNITSPYLDRRYRRSSKDGKATLRKIGQRSTFPDLVWRKF